MKTEVWSIKSRISGSFFLTKDETINSSSPPHPLVRKFSIIPEFDAKNNQTGFFNLAIDFVVDTEDGEKAEAYLIADLARDIHNYYINLLTFLSGNEVRIIKPTELKHDYQEGGRFREIIIEPETANLNPPVPLTNTYLISNSINSELSRVLSFYAYGLMETDIISSIYFLLSALDMLAEQFEVNEKVIRKCESCGYEKEIEPGSAAKIKNVLINICGYSMEDYKNIWKTRNLIFHGAFSLSSKNIREIVTLRNKVNIALIRAIKCKVNLHNDDLPIEKDQNWFTDPILDLEYVVPLANQQSS